MKIMSIESFVWLVIFHDTKGPVKKSGLTGKRGEYKKSLSRCSFEKKKFKVSVFNALF